MALQGNHNTLSIPDLLSFILQHKLSGALVVVSRLRERAFVFRDGELAYTLATDPHLLLGELLIEELDVDRTTLKSVLANLAEGEYLGQALVREEIVTQDDLDEVVVRKVRRALREVLRWEEWAFHFHSSSDAKDLPILQQSTRTLVFDLIRELDEWGSLDQIFETLDVVVERKPGSVRSSRPREWPAELPPPGEILTHLEGRRTLRKLLEESPYPVRSFATGLSQLIEVGALQLSDKPELDLEERQAAYPLPVTSAVAARILTKLSREEVSLEDLYDLILSDPVLVSRTLRVAGVRTDKSSEPLSMRRVICKVGLETLRTVLIGEAVRALYMFPELAVPARQVEDTVMASRACLLLADMTGFEDPELAQVAGLVQDVGSLVLAADNGDAYCEVYLRLVESGNTDILNVEREIFQTHHCIVGSQLADTWHFPQDLRAIVREHHSPLDHPKNDLLTLVRLANSIAQSRHAPRYYPTKADRRFCRRLGLTQVDLENVRNEVIHAPQIKTRAVDSELTTA